MRKIHRWGWEGVPSEKIRERADRPPKQKAINTVLEVIYGHLQEKSVSTGQDDAKEEQPMHPARLESFPFWARGNFYRERFRWEREAYDSLRAFLSLFSSSSSPVGDGHLERWVALWLCWSQLKSYRTHMVHQRSMADKSHSHSLETLKPNYHVHQSFL